MAHKALHTSCCARHLHDPLAYGSSSIKPILPRAEVINGHETLEAFRTDTAATHEHGFSTHNSHNWYRGSVVSTFKLRNLSLELGIRSDLECLVVEVAKGFRFCRYSHTEAGPMAISAISNTRCNLREMRPHDKHAKGTCRRTASKLHRSPETRGHPHCPLES